MAARAGYVGAKVCPNYKFARVLYPFASNAKSTHSENE
jgi:hypothetical protein